MNIKTQYQVVNVQDMINFWVKEYQLPEGQKIIRHDHYYDPQKGKIVLALMIEDETGATIETETADT